MKVVIGVDSGGSTTRALAATLEGEPVGYGESGGGNATHDVDSRANVREAIARAAESFGIECVVRVVAGVAGMTGREAWASETTEIPGIRAVREHLNDTDVGHYAAFGRNPGILSVQGTGSGIFAVTDKGERVRNGDLSHYARGGAVWLGINAMWASFAGVGPALTAAVCETLEVESIEALRSRVRTGWTEAKVKSAAMGAIARRTTALAEAGDADAIRLCRTAAGEIVEGIRLLGALFVGSEIPVAFVGACVRSAAMRREVEAGLAATGRGYRIVEPAVPPVVGAVLMALEAEGVILNDEARRRLVGGIGRKA